MHVTRRLRNDSLGRMVLNVEPNTTVGFSADPSTPANARKAWQYAYDDAGDLGPAHGTVHIRGARPRFTSSSAGPIPGGLPPRGVQRAQTVK